MKIVILLMLAYIQAQVGIVQGKQTIKYKRFSIFKAWKSMPKVHIIHVDIKIDFADSKLIAAACYWSTLGQSWYDRFAALFRGVVSRHNR